MWWKWWKFDKSLVVSYGLEETERILLCMCCGWNLSLTPVLYWRKGYSDGLYCDFISWTSTSYGPLFGSTCLAYWHTPKYLNTIRVTEVND